MLCSPCPPFQFVSPTLHLQVINGQIVVDTSSLTIQAQRGDDVTTYTRVEEDARLINTQSYMKKTSG